MNQLFNDDLSCMTRLWQNARYDPETGKTAILGPPQGVEVIIKCHTCDTPVQIGYPWQEVMTLLQGGMVQGVQRDAGGGWVAATGCPGCQQRNHNTTLKYKLSVGDLQKHFANMRGRAF